MEALPDPSLSFSELAQFELDPKTIRYLDRSFCEENQVVLLRRPSRNCPKTVVGMLNPEDREQLRAAEGRLGAHIHPVQLNDYEIQKALDYAFGEEEEEEELDPFFDEVVQDRDINHVHLHEEMAIQFEPDQGAADLVDELIASAVHRGASDIHVENYRDDIDLRFRIDGVLHQITTPLSPSNIRRVVSRIKVLSHMDLAEHRLPQDGRIFVTYEGHNGERTIDLRVSVLPCPFGENVVIRILDPQAAEHELVSLGMCQEQTDQLLDLLRVPEGIILVVGPSGSGKTTSLYACVQHLVSPEVKIMTVEDPVEYEMSKVSQHQVSRKMGFADYAKAFLRQDPDVLMLGEIRDEETAGLAVRAALTGHLVLATLHSTDCVSALTRLRDLGAANNALASVLKAIVAQRLVRRICTSCNGADSGDDKAHKRSGKPCAHCHGVGYRGRVGLYETLVPDAEMRSRIGQGVLANDLRASLPDDFYSLATDARQKVEDGITTEEEVRRCIQ